MNGMKKGKEIDVKQSFPFLNLELLRGNPPKLEHAGIENDSVQPMIFFECSGHGLEVDWPVRTEPKMIRVPTS